jgi:Cu(I)/Ag(I) efflux system membrane fusion protein
MIMKKMMMLLAAVLTMSAAGAKTVKTTFSVNGKCADMCKPNIEKAAQGVKGVVSAKWNLKTHKLVLIYDDAKTSPLAVQKAIAAKGYDAGKVKAGAAAYAKLPKCCQYR